MDTIKIKIDNVTLEKMLKFYDSHRVNREDDEYVFIAKTVGCEITCFKNMTVTFHGNNATTEVAHWKKLRPKDHFDKAGHYIGSHIGVAEYGSKDYYGPICVVSCYVDENDVEWLKQFKLGHVHNLEDQEIVEIAKQIKDKILYSLLILDNIHYNSEINKGANQSNIKARLHNDAVINAMQKIQKPVEKKVATQFIASKTYFNYLKSEVVVAKDVELLENAEEYYYGVACSYVLAKYAYLQYYTKICKTLKMQLPRGTSNQVDIAGAKIVRTYGEKTLIKVAKVNLNNTKKIKEILKKAKQENK